MSMRYTNKRYTICEVVKELNDLHQGDSEHDTEVRSKLITIEQMAKRMVLKLTEYRDEKKLKKELFPKKNPNYREKKQKRKEKEYKAEDIEI